MLSKTSSMKKLDNYVERKVKEKFSSPTADQTKAYQYYETLGRVSRVLGPMLRRSSNMPVSKVAQ